MASTLAPRGVNEKCKDLYIYICGVFKQSQILTWKTDFGLFGLGFHDDGFNYISQKRALEEFHVKFKWN